mgnify:CR=1 FL=1
MARLHRQNYYDIERIIEFDFVRATEAAALNSLRWLGRGDKEAADAAALRRDARHVRSDEHLRRGRDRRRNQGRSAGHF